IKCKLGMSCYKCVYSSQVAVDGTLKLSSSSSSSSSR
ncbi:hypothetical protein Ahia01_001071400, partial [Argonauta hians]